MIGNSRPPVGAILVHGGAQLSAGPLGGVAHGG
jgi:hypothetical protein